ncbi:NADPH:quinone reductase [Enterococcus thailandicus]|uniref:NADPH:quinone reductase n=3 Tax=root TaxID=1 RepID=A0A510WGG7_ENTTH|nr:oxidoreductase, zinc-binding [Enterococcus thailandicus]GEK38226.1 NADPH:quinone reductase [Enterococcus thailandicus]GMC04241.1 NADPH:quinone reductase [Enterococcus thailandicus]GMC08162.1 NADPH:quinone reductase [Enterococcus thailandicus]
MKNTMKAAVIDTYKQPTPKIKEVPIPDIRSNDVLVKIVAASINPIDIKTKDGGLKMLLSYDMPIIMGSDFAGIITAVGEKVTNYSIGDAVYGRVQKNRIGTFAEYIAVDQGAIALKPKNINFEEAASIPLVGLTSYQALHDIMQIQPGQKVMIQGGSGGIGTIAIQLAKYLGAYVATTTSANNFDLVKSLGADYPINYQTTNFAEVLQDYDYVFDTRGGATLEAAFKIIKPGGKVVSIAGLPNYRFGKEYGVPLWKQFAFKMVTRNLTKLEKQTQASYTFLFMKPSGTQLDVLRHLIEAEIIKPVIDRIVPLSEVKEALSYSQSGRATGKIILQMTGDSENEIRS